MNNNDFNKKIAKGKTWESCKAKVIVKDGAIDKALQQLKRKIKDSGTMFELRNRSEFIKPSAKRREVKMNAIHRQKCKEDAEE